MKTSLENRAQSHDAEKEALLVELGGIAVFQGVGAMTDFGPLIANPISFLMGAAAQLGIYLAYFMAILMGFSDKAAAAISIIGGADGPTSIFLCGKLGQTQYMGPIAVAAYSYMSLVPIIQPPIMKMDGVFLIDHAERESAKDNPGNGIHLSGRRGAPRQHLLQHYHQFHQSS